MLAQVFWAGLRQLSLLFETSGSDAHAGPGCTPQLAMLFLSFANPERGTHLEVADTMCCQAPTNHCCFYILFSYFISDLLRLINNLGIKKSSCQSLKCSLDSLLFRVINDIIRFKGVIVIII